MKFLDKYKGTLIKLCTPTLTNEVWGILLDVDKSTNYIKLGKAIIISSKFTLEPARIFDQIIRYKYDANASGTLTTPLNPLYNNDGTDSVSWICLDNWTFIPIHLSSFNKVKKIDDGDIHYKRQSDIISTMLAYIDAVYSDYDAAVSDIDDAVSEHDAIVSDIDNVPSDSSDTENIVDISMSKPSNDEQNITQTHEDN